MKKTSLAIFAVVALLLAMILPTVAFAEDIGPIDANLAAALGLSGAGVANDQGFGGFGSDTDQKASITNVPIQLGLAGGMQTSKVFGSSDAMSIAKSGWQVSVGSVQLVNLEPKQFASADAKGDNKVNINGGASRTINSGSNYADGGYAIPVAAGAFADSGDIDVDSGDTDAGIMNRAFGMANGGGNADATTLASGNNLAIPVAIPIVGAGVYDPAMAMGGPASASSTSTGSAWGGPASGAGGAGTGGNGGAGGAGVPTGGVGGAGGYGAGGAGSANSGAAAVADPISTSFANPTGATSWGQAAAWAQANAAANQTGGGNASAWAGGNDPASNCFNQGGTVGVANPASNTGSTGAANASNTAGAATANGGANNMYTVGGNGGSALGYGIGNYGGTAVNSMGAISVGNTGTASGSTGAATTGATTSSFNATASNCDSSTTPLTQNQWANPNISQNDSDPQSVWQGQTGTANSSVANSIPQNAQGWSTENINKNWTSNFTSNWTANDTNTVTGSNGVNTNQ